MPKSYTIDEARGLSRTTVSRVVADADAIGHVAGLTTDPRVRYGFRELAHAATPVKR